VSLRIAPVALVLMLAPLTAFAAPLRASGRAPAYRPGEVLVAVGPGAGLTAGTDGRAAARNPALAAVLSRFGLAHARNLRTSTDEASRHAEVFLLTRGQPGFDPAAAAAELRSQPGVLGASPNARLQLHVTPNDPYIGYQWHWATAPRRSTRPRAGIARRAMPRC
jgi:hypothetical protein